MLRRLVILLLAGLSAGPVLAQKKPTPLPPLADPFEVARLGFGNGKTGCNYLEPMLRLYVLKPDFHDRPEVGLLNQAFATYHAFGGGEDSAWYYFYNRRQRSTQPLIGTRSTAFKTIAAKLKTQLVMFNEAHTQPKGRAYVNTWLPKLYESGFRYLALEALAEDSALMKRGMPTLTSGFYTREPQMADLIRTALKVGFKLVSYDSDGPDREQAQARNLIGKTFAHGPDAKVVVLAGHAHIDEDSTHGKSMAVWLRRLTGIDPLTIDQTRAEPYTVTRGEAEVALIPNGSYPWSNQKGIKADIYVLNELEVWDYANVYGGLQSGPIKVFLPDTVLKQDWCQAQVFLKEEMEKVPNPVPVYVRLLKGEHGKIDPYLAYGAYVIEVRDRGMNLLWRRELDHLPESQGR